MFIPSLDGKIFDDFYDPFERFFHSSFYDPFFEDLDPEASIEQEIQVVQDADYDLGQETTTSTESSSTSTTTLQPANTTLPSNYSTPSYYNNYNKNTTTSQMNSTTSTTLMKFVSPSQRFIQVPRFFQPVRPVIRQRLPVQRPPMGRQVFRAPFRRPVVNQTPRFNPFLQRQQTQRFNPRPVQRIVQRPIFRSRFSNRPIN